MRNLLALLLAAVLVLPATAMAAASSQPDLQKEINDLHHKLRELDSRVSKNELHTALDRINFTGDLRVKADTLYYKNLTLTSMNPATGQISAQQYNRQNDILYTTRLRLNMNAKVWKNVKFMGRLTMYKNWGDSTGVKVLDGFNDITMDGTDSGNTTGDWLRVERAFFSWYDIAGSHFYLSVGRRPSTYGPPTQFRENEPRGGTPSGQLVNFDFDGITVGYNMSDLTGIEGQEFRFCYGQGYESQLGNGTFGNPHADIRDTHLGGFDFDLLNNGATFVQALLFQAVDVTDGFKGLAALPTSLAVGSPNYANTSNINIVARLDATKNIGNITLGGLVLTRQEDNGVNWFVALGWDRTEPNGAASQDGFGGLMVDSHPVVDANGNVTGYVANNDDSHNGYSVYAGVQVPAPLGKFGLEYNYGSKYWFAFTQAQDDIVGSKLATRGHVGEAYYIFDVNPHMFIKLGGIYYKYEYSGSGVPVGAPHSITDIKAGRAFSFFPVADQVWDGYLSLTCKF